MFWWLVLAAVLLAPAVARAQPPAGGEAAPLEAQKEALFQQMLRNPGNLDAAFAYADVSARLGDYEAAVATLDRMLLFNHMIGTVFNNGQQYVAAGGVTATYQFATQMGTFSVNKYDGMSFMTPLGKAPLAGANYTFGINNPQGVPIAGVFNGSFYGPSAANTGGNFNLHTTAPGPTYLTSGIFAAAKH